MTTGERDGPELPIEGAPTWVRILQAVLIGIFAGLALHVLLSMVVLRGQGIGSGPAGPIECRKPSPARDAAAPAAPVLRISALRPALPAHTALR